MVKKIISGGQTWADEAGLDVSIYTCQKRILRTSIILNIWDVVSPTCGA